MRCQGPQLSSTEEEGRIERPHPGAVMAPNGFLNAFQAVWLTIPLRLYWETQVASNAQFPVMVDQGTQLDEASWKTEQH